MIRAAMNRSRGRTFGIRTPLAARGSPPPRFVYHPSFDDVGAESKHVGPVPEESSAGFLSDQATRALAQGMHYAAYRAQSGRSSGRWLNLYYECRDRIMLGNRKLVFGVVLRLLPDRRFLDDVIGECNIVLLRAIAHFDPWRGVRFSTYACTCLGRAVCRLRRQMQSDRLLTAGDVHDLADEGPAIPTEDGPTAQALRFTGFLREEDAVLTHREKRILRRRFFANGPRSSATLACVGAELGLSKERVRQLQEKALAKLRVLVQ
jgi:RNA polymerase sigma factor (sigma-70 family)